MLNLAWLSLITHYTFHIRHAQCKQYDDGDHVSYGPTYQQINLSTDNIVIHGSVVVDVVDVAARYDMHPNKYTRGQIIYFAPAEYMHMQRLSMSVL